MVETNFDKASQPRSDYARELAAQALGRLDMDFSKGFMKTISEGRQEVHKVNPYLLNIREGWNSREPSAENQEHIENLARSIAEVGVKEPLRAYVEENTIWLTNGHCRLLAVFHAIEVLGAEIKRIPVIMEDRHASDADRLLTQIVSNSGKPLSQLEQGNVFKRLIDLGWTEAEIAQKSGFASAQRVTQILELYAAPEEVKNMVRRGEVSASQAWKTLKAHGEHNTDAAVAELTEGLEQARAEGKSKVTARFLDSEKEKPTQAKGKSAPTLRAALKRVFEDADVTEEEDRVTLVITPQEYEILCERLGL